MKKFLIVIASIAMFTGLVGSAQASAPAAKPPAAKASTAASTNLTTKQLIAGQNRLLKSNKSAAFKKPFRSQLKKGAKAKTSAGSCTWIHHGGNYWGCYDYRYSYLGYGVYRVYMYYIGYGYYAEYLYWNVSWPNYYWFYLGAL
jgi:hypothetical protein